MTRVPPMTARDETSMVERVARAMDEAADRWAVRFNNLAWECPSEVLARTAIEAMRTPTEAMLEAPYEADIDFGPGGTGDIQASPENVWQAMIAAALSED